MVTTGLSLDVKIKKYLQIRSLPRFSIDPENYIIYRPFTVARVVEISRCDILSFLMVKLLFIVNTAAQVQILSTTIFIGNIFFIFFTMKIIFLKKYQVRFCFSSWKIGCCVYQSLSCFEVNKILVSQSRAICSNSLV